MTRMLADLLGLREPDFGLNIKRLERASGDPGADIRLSSEIMRRTQEKIQQLGLDPHDTTGPELYGILLERLKADDTQVRTQLGIAADADTTTIMQAVKKFVDKLSVPRSCFALKSSVAKRLLKKLPPKKAMQALGYRSIDSFLKHEPVALIYAAAWGNESETWRREFVAQYRRLQPGDFEPRRIQLMVPATSRWKSPALTLSKQLKQSSLYFKELGVVVLLPLPASVPGLTMVSLLFALHNIDDIRSASAYLKLQQVKPDFGSVVAQTVLSEPALDATVAGQPLSWQLLQHYFGLIRNRRADLFEPHVQAEDLAWQYPETELAKAVPALAFWADSIDLGLLDSHQPVSLNLFDVALSYCNQLPFSERVVHYLRETVKHELLMSYMHQEAVEQTITGQLGSQLLGDPLLA